MPNQLDHILGPVRRGLDIVRDELGRLADGFSYPVSREIVRRFLDSPGKLLRPALVLLSADAVTEPIEDSLVRACLGVELIHSSSLVHDDILDGDDERRGQPTVHRQYGNQVAVLIGDALYSRGFGILTEILPKNLMLQVARVVEGMCTAEIEQAHGAAFERQAYFRIIEGKTASLMSLCCRLGPVLAGAPETEAMTMERFGLLFGLAYQLFDDTADHDLPVAGLDGSAEALRCLVEAQVLLDGLPATEGRSRLRDLCRYLLAANSAAAHQTT